MADTPAGFRQVLGSDPFDIPLDINRAELFLEDYFGRSVNTPAELPANGGRPGRTIWVISEHCGYVWDGTAWHRPPIDTGWTPFALGGGWTTGSIVPACRVKDGITYLGGAATRSSNITVPTTVGTLPAVARPAQQVFLVMPSANSAVATNATILPAGTIQVTQFLGSSATLYFGGSFPVD